MNDAEQKKESERVRKHVEDVQKREAKKEKDKAAGKNKKDQKVCDDAGEGEDKKLKEGYDQEQAYCQDWAKVCSGMRYATTRAVCIRSIHSGSTTCTRRERSPPRKRATSSSLEPDSAQKVARGHSRGNQ